MWALRRAHTPLKYYSFGVVLPRLHCLNGEVPISHGEDDAYTVRFSSPGRLNWVGYIRAQFLSGKSSFSSQAGEKSGREQDDLEDWFSEIGKPVSTSSELERNENVDNELISEQEHPEDVDAEISENECNLLEAETGPGRTVRSNRKVTSRLFEAISTNPNRPVGRILDQWLGKGNNVDQHEFWSAMLLLRRRRLYAKALQASEWWERTKPSEFVERDYASRVDLIAKVKGLPAAEYYIQKIPEAFRGELVYRTLLANSVASGSVKESEEVFNKMRDLDFPLSAFACNQLLLLYKRLDRKKIADVLLLMEKENVKPTLFTYKILLDSKGKSKDLTGVDQIVEMMKAEGVEPDILTQCIVAKIYISGGLPEKADPILKEMEGGDLKWNRSACSHLLPLYAELGNVEEVRRVWSVCEPRPSMVESAALMEAWGKLKRVEEAEAVFDRMSTTWKKLGPQHYLTLLKVYANGNMLNKGKDLVRRMSESGCDVGPLIWDEVVKLYLGAGEVEKADAFLQRACQQKSGKRPLYQSLLSIMVEFARRGDVHNTEKIFLRLRQFGYITRIQQFRLLVQAYMNADVPAYGLRERMKVDNIFPDKGLAEQLAQVDAFRRTGLEKLLESSLLECIT